MKNTLFIVHYTNENNCFAYLSDNLLRQSERGKNVIQILCKGKYVYASFRLKSINTNILYLNSIFAKNLGIDDREEVFISIVDICVPDLKSVYAVAKKEQDREIVELHFDKIQSSLLNQINIVAVNQPIIVWVSKFCSATLKVESLDPECTYGYLRENTEIHIDHATMESTAIKDKGAEDLSRLNWSKYTMTDTIIVRGIVLAETEPRNSLLCPYHVFMRKSDIEDNIYKLAKDNKSIFCKISKLHEKNIYADHRSMAFLTNDDSPFSDIHYFYAQLFIVDETNISEFQSIIPLENIVVSGSQKSLFISPEFSLNLRMKTGGKLKLEIVEFTVEDISSIEVYSIVEMGQLTEQDVVDYIGERSKNSLLLLNANNILKLKNNNLFILKVLPITSSYGFFDADRLKRLKVNVHNNIQHVENLEEYLKSTKINLDNIYLRGIDAIIKECITACTLKLSGQFFNDMDYKCDHILICGGIGSGKTTICKVLGKFLNDSPFYVHTLRINCTLMKGKKAEIVHKLLSTAITDCVYYQQSILFLDNLDSITNYTSNQEENNLESMNTARIAEVLFELITEVQNLHNVSIIATCLNYNSVGEKLRILQGNHFFRTVLTIQNLDKKNRIDVIKQFCKYKTNISENINWEYFGNVSYGWVYQDFTALTEKAAFAAWKRYIKEKNKGEELCIEEKDLLDALVNFRSINLHDIKLFKNDGHSWLNIGGLRHVKKTLTELLQWPLKYYSLFKNAPIKHQSGILLYGMPGTGKTLVATALSKQFGINLISIKGPELLSKYIGASEEAVRNVFQKALVAKPCILFFDEFDSLAPRRGHDNTGVTDRVVNQLLTQLDGVEERKGIVVIAATSRPDLIDPAILRPGRLDKIILCPMPDKTDREEILSILSKTYKVDLTVEALGKLTYMTDGFTGADLHVIFKQAKLNAFHKTSDQRMEKDNILSINYDDIVECLKFIKPSLPLLEKEKFKIIYEKFTKDDTLPEDSKYHQRVTLA